MKNIVRVCVISDGSSNLIVPSEQWTDHIAEINDWGDADEFVYTITFKNMSQKDFDSLSEFGGF